MNDNKRQLLVFDRMQYLITGVYTLVTSDKKMTFSFKCAEDQIRFIHAFYLNKTATIFAYYATSEIKNEAINR